MEPMPTPLGGIVSIKSTHVAETGHLLSARLAPRRTIVLNIISSSTAAIKLFESQQRLHDGVARRVHEHNLTSESVACFTPCHSFQFDKVYNF
jgi:hypothetical protein